MLICLWLCPDNFSWVSYLYLYLSLSMHKYATCPCTWSCTKFLVVQNVLTIVLKKIHFIVWDVQPIWTDTVIFESMLFQTQIRIPITCAYLKKLASLKNENKWEKTWLTWLTAAKYKIQKIKYNKNITTGGEKSWNSGAVCSGGYCCFA